MNPPNRLTRVPDAVLFGAALCLICAPALLGGSVDEFHDDGVEASEGRCDPLPSSPRTDGALQHGVERSGDSLQLAPTVLPTR